MSNIAAAALVYAGYTNQFGLTNAMGTTAQIVKVGPGYLGVVINNQANAQANSVSLYDSNNVNSIGASNLIQTITLGASATQVFNFPFVNGLIVQANGGAITGIVWLTFS